MVLWLFWFVRCLCMMRCDRVWMVMVWCFVWMDYMCKVYCWVIVLFGMNIVVCLLSRCVIFCLSVLMLLFLL